MDVNPNEICVGPAARSRKLTTLPMLSAWVLDLSEENPSCRPTPATEKTQRRAHVGPKANEVRVELRLPGNPPTTPLPNPN